MELHTLISLLIGKNLLFHLLSVQIKMSVFPFALQFRENNTLEIQPSHKRNFVTAINGVK